jgi:methylamine dehydrogenase heavy chain
MKSVATLALVLTVNAAALADVPAEVPGRVEKLPEPLRAHWTWIADPVLERVALVDADDGKFLGLINGGYGPLMPLFPARRSEIYLPATYYSRRSRGERTDVLEIYDAVTLGFLAEVVVPPKRALDAVVLGHSALSDDDRFVALFNWTPVTSLSIVDVEQRTFAGEIGIAGCSLVYAAGDRRFFSLCSDGTALVLTLDDEGKERNKERSAPFFAPFRDPITEKAVRYRNQWLFASFEGKLYTVDVFGPQISFAEPWDLLSEADRRQSWRIGGLQHLAVHEGTGRLYSLMHRGGPDTHKEPGEEIWVYDLATRRRVQRIELRSPGITIYGFPVELGKAWLWPLNRLDDWLINTFVPAEVSHIQVTQDDAPLLLTAAQFSGAIGVYDARTGEFLRRVQPVGWTSDLILAPWKGAGH